MPNTSIACGVLLIIIGIIGYVHGMMSDKASVTALIPAFFGLVFVILGVLANAKESLRKHLMHCAVIVSLLGFIMPAGRLISKMSELTMSAAIVSQIAMAVVCLIFTILAIRSFAAVRKNNG